MSQTQLYRGQREREICTEDHEAGLGTLRMKPPWGGGGRGGEGGVEEEKQKQCPLINLAYLSSTCHFHPPRFIWSPGLCLQIPLTSHKLSLINFRHVHRRIYRSKIEILATKASLDWESQKGRKQLPQVFILQIRT